MGNPGCPRHAKQFDRTCYDVRCTSQWEVEGAPTPDEQLDRWAKGEAVCPNTRHECCPDFGCCKPNLGWSLEKRAKFIASDQRTREKMMMGSLSAFVESANVKAYITRGSPKDNE